MKNMKKRVVMITTLILCVNCCLPGIVAMAAQNENETTEEENSQNDHLWRQFFNAFNIEKERDSKEAVGKKKGELTEAELEEGSEAVEAKENCISNTSEMKRLQMPQKLEIVIDPWEIDGKGQIYSEQYRIRNMGEASGILTLSNLTCTPREHSGVVVRSDKADLHDNKDKSIYMEMLFNNKEMVILTDEETEYQAELKAGEELTIYFKGEVNEYASKEWENGDVSVTVVYSWEVKEMSDCGIEDLEEDESLEEIEKTEKMEEPEKSEKPTQETGAEEEKPEAGLEDEEEILKVDEKLEEPGESGQPGDLVGTEKSDILGEPEKSERPEELGESEKPIETGEENQPEGTLEDDKDSKDNVKTEQIDLQVKKKQELSVDFKTAGENEQIVSARYIMRNTGETAGVLTLSDILCKLKEQSEIAVRAEREELYDTEAPSVYIEVKFGNGEKIILSGEHSEYKSVLKPGEELSFQFVGEMNQQMARNWEEGDVVVTAACFWNLEDTVSE